MSRKVRERATIKQFGELFNRFGIKLDFATASSFIDEVIELVHPETMRSDPEILAEAFQRIRDDLETLQEGFEVQLDLSMKKVGLDPAVLSDRSATRKFLNENGMLTHQKAAPERWVKRIAAPTTNGGQSAK